MREENRRISLEREFRSCVRSRFSRKYSPSPSSPPVPFIVRACTNGGIFFLITTDPFLLTGVKLEPSCILREIRFHALLWQDSAMNTRIIMHLYNTTFLAKCDSFDSSNRNPIDSCHFLFCLDLYCLRYYLHLTWQVLFIIFYPIGCIVWLVFRVAGKFSKILLFLFRRLLQSTGSVLIPSRIWTAPRKSESPLSISRSTFNVNFIVPSTFLRALW